jgi:hypothetical protein
LLDFDPHSPPKSPQQMDRLGGRMTYRFIAIEQDIVLHIRCQEKQITTPGFLTALSG